MNFNPGQNEIDFVNDSLARFNDEKFRGKGIGSKLLLAAEEEARRRECHAVHVDTMSWQAPEFYKKHGYKIISELDDIPLGNKKFHLVKDL